MATAEMPKIGLFIKKYAAAVPAGAHVGLRACRAASAAGGSASLTARRRAASNGGSSAYRVEKSRVALARRLKIAAFSLKKTRRPVRGRSWPGVRPVCVAARGAPASADWLQPSSRGV